MSTSGGIDPSLAADINLSDCGGVLTEEILAKAMREMAPYNDGPVVRYMGKQETELRLAGKHPVYPPDDEALMPEWRENADRFWAWYAKEYV